MKLKKTFDFNGFYEEIANYIRGARQKVLRTVNSEMSNAYWNIGRRIVEVEQAGEARASYGSNLLERLSEELMQEFDKGFAPARIKGVRNQRGQSKLIFNESVIQSIYSDPFDFLL